MSPKTSVSPIIFIASVLCFLFPFVTVSCGGQRVATFSGAQLATGTTVEQPQMLGPPQKQRVDPEPFVALAALCALVGLGLSFAGVRVAIGTAISGAVGTVSLLLMKSRMDDQIVNQGHGMLQVNYETAYSLTLILFIAGAAWNTYLFSQRRQSVGAGGASIGSGVADVQDPPGVVPHGPIASKANTTIPCPGCGETLLPDPRFCTSCGRPVN
jgi:hypothetical protein